MDIGNLKNFIRKLAFELYSDNFRYSSIEKLVKTFGLKDRVLGEGCSRMAIALDEDYVIKIALHSDGIADNQYEFDAYCGMDADSKYYYAAVYDILEDGVALIQERCKPLSSYKPLPYGIEDSIPLHLIRDNHYGNFGINKDGKVVVLDFAC